MDTMARTNSMAENQLKPPPKQKTNNTFTNREQVFMARRFLEETLGFIWELSQQSTLIAKEAIKSDWRAGVSKAIR